MNNRTTQRLVNRNIHRHFAVEQKAKEEYQPEKALLPLAEEGSSRTPFAPWTGLTALVVQVLSLIGL